MIGLSLSLSLGSQRSGGSPTPPAEKAMIGANLESLRWWTRTRTLTNMATAIWWQDSAASGQPWIIDPEIVSPDGELLKLGSTVPEGRLSQPVESGTSRIRLEYTGTATIALLSSTSAVSDQTTGTDGDIHWIEYDLTVSDLATVPAAGNHSIKITSMSEADPLRNVYCAEVVSKTPNGGARSAYKETGYFHPSLIALCEPLKELRFMDLAETNGTWDLAHPVTMANRARALKMQPAIFRSAYASNMGIAGTAPCKAVLGTGGTTVTLYPGYYRTNAFKAAFADRAANPGSVTAAPGIIELTPFGADANLISIVLNAASGSGAISFDPKTMVLTITPATGADAPADIKGQITSLAADNIVRSYIDDIHIETVGTGSVAPGTYQMSGGISPQRYGMIGIEEMVSLCNAANADLYFNFPISAADDYVEYVGSYVAENLKTALKSTFEVGNEVWNPAFRGTAMLAASAYARDSYGAKTAGRSDIELAACRVVELAKHFRSIVEPYFTSRTLKFAFNAQHVNIANVKWVMGTGAPATDFQATFDVLATAPYIGRMTFYAPDTGVTPTWSAASVAYPLHKSVIYGGSLYICILAHTSTATTPDADSTHWVLGTDAPDVVDTIMRADVDTQLATAVSNRAYAASIGLEYSTYEAGTHFEVPDTVFIEKYQTDDSVYGWYAYYIAEFLRVTGSNSVFQQFGLVGGGTTTNFCALRYNKEADASAPKWRVLKDVMEGNLPVYWAAGSAPTISGTFAVGEILTANVGVLRNADTTIIQWTRDGVDIVGATASTYAQTSADTDAVINITVTATGAVNSATASSANTTATVAKAAVVLVFTAPGSSSFTLPDDWPGTGTVAIQGAGGAGVVSAADGGGYRNSGGTAGYTEFTLTGAPGDVISYNLPVGGVFGSANPADATFGPTYGAHSGTNATNTTSGAGVGGAAWTGGTPTIARAGTNGSLAAQYSGGAGGPGAPGPLGLGGKGAIGSASWGSPGGGADNGQDGSLGGTSQTGVGGNAGANGGIGGNCARKAGAISAQQGVNGGGSGGGGWKSDGSANPDFIHGADATYEPLFTSTINGETVGPGGGPGSAGDHFPTTDAAPGRGGNGKFGSGGAGGCVTGHGNGGDAWAVLTYQP